MNINISVREVIEFACRSGNIDNTITQTYLMERAVEGTIVHGKIQSKRVEYAKENNFLYEKELSLSLAFEVGEHIVKLQGRADGVITDDNGITIEELKSTRKALENIEPQILHQLQMEIYGYIYCISNGINNINLKLVYIAVETLEEKVFEYSKTIDELFDITKNVIDKYCEFLNLAEKCIKQRNETIMKVEFPHSHYRKNQRELMKSVYYAINEENDIFIEAPTGTGKTISTLFPTLKALGEDTVEKVFYVTAKTITRQEAKKSLQLLENDGLYMRSIVLTAKEKICFLNQSDCRPESCSYAIGHFDRVNAGILDLVENESIIDREVILEYAKKHNICPHEFQLDVSYFCDVVIGDYNNVYNPSSKLIRYFAEGGNYVVLLDEAHNLYDRACDMFTSTLEMKTLEKLYDISNNISKGGKVAKNVLKLIYELDKYHDLENFETIELEDYPKDIINRMRGLQSLIRSDEELLQNREVSPIYLEIIDFIRIADIYNIGHTVTVKKVYSNIILKLLCLNPSEYISGTNKLIRSVVYFSATLTPPNYFKDVYGGKSENLYFTIPSPFNIENTKVLINTNIKTTYKHRNLYYKDIANNIKAMVDSKVGNYFVFFSSYEYLNNVYDVFSDEYSNIDVIVQKQNMTDDERDDFLNNFKSQPILTKVAFVVLGGIFGEGIDLIGDRLIGVCVVGVGLPMLTFERDLVKNSFDRGGYDYAYTYPGFNKVMQGIGRLIRTETDKGIILLLDERYGYRLYKELFPENFSNVKYIKNGIEVEKECYKFWNKNSRI